MRGPHPHHRVDTGPTPGTGSGHGGLISVQARIEDPAGKRASDLVRLGSMMSLYFVVLVSVGILRPVKNALALDGRAEGDFYQVYLVSALAVLFAPVFNHLADRVPWRRLIPATAAFFALNLVLFRVAYSDGSTTFGLIFYGWYDLFAAALVTQFFM
ncbi:MAG: hypothetical protein PVF69_12315, partial [Gemmatimonadota bacterium]